MGKSKHRNLEEEVTVAQPIKSIDALMAMSSSKLSKQYNVPDLFLYSMRGSYSAYLFGDGPEGERKQFKDERKAKRNLPLRERLRDYGDMTTFALGTPLPYSMIERDGGGYSIDAKGHPIGSPYRIMVVVVEGKIIQQGQLTLDHVVRIFGDNKYNSKIIESYNRSGQK